MGDAPAYYRQPATEVFAEDARRSAVHWERAIESVSVSEVRLPR